jgi:hypothetical protein
LVSLAWQLGYAFCDAPPIGRSRCIARALRLRRIHLEQLQVVVDEERAGRRPPSIASPRIRSPKTVRMSFDR